MGTVGTIITILSFAAALVAISGSIGYVTTKVNNIEADTLKCLREIQDFHREIYHWLDAVSGETKHTRKIVEEIDKRV